MALTPALASSKARVVIVGGGTAGITTAAQLLRVLPDAAVTIVDPSETHDYQPIWTLVGGGIVPKQVSRRPMASVIPRRARWLRDAVELFEPGQNRVRTRGGVNLSYDVLVVAAGLEIHWHKIAGLAEALGTGGVCSNYSYAHVGHTWDSIRNFKSGNALFTFPDTPIKCAGAPQKIMYLAERHFQRTGRRQDARVQFLTPLEKIFSVPKYAAALTAICGARGIDVTFKRNLVAIDAMRKVATFQVVNADAAAAPVTEEISYAMIHVGPPMGAPAFIKASPLANAAGFVDVDKATMQHAKWPNIFALGDASSLPTSKTGAAIRAQAPVVVEHIVATLAHRPLTQRYDGYTSCPLVTDYGKLILAEFDYELKPRETFPFDQGKERRSMYLLKRYVLPFLYWHLMLPGRTLKGCLAAFRRILRLNAAPAALPAPEPRRG